MTRIKFINNEYGKLYSNILNFPSLGIYPEKRHQLADAIQQVSDIDNIPYRTALDMMCDAFVSRYFIDDHNASHVRELEKAICNLTLLRYLDELCN